MSNFTINDLHTKAIRHHEQLNWINALFSVIDTDLKGKGYEAKYLIEIGKYLTEDLANHAEVELEQVTREMQEMGDKS